MTYDHIRRYGLAGSLVAFATAIRLALDPILGDRHPYAFYYLAILLASWQCGLGPSILSIVLGWGVSDVLFVPPRGSLVSTDLASALGSSLFWCIAVPIVAVFERLRAGSRLIEEHSRRLARSELEQRREKRLYLSILNSMAEGVFACDRDGGHILSNPAMESMVGPLGPSCTLADLVARLRPLLPDGATLIAPDDLPIGRALRGEAGTERELVVRPPGCEPLVLATTARMLLDDSGQCNGAVAIYRNVSAQKRADEELRASRDRFQKFIDQIPIVTWIKDADGRFLHVNRAYERLFGLPSSLLVGKSSHDLFPSEDSERHRAEDKRALDSVEPIMIDESLALPDGSRAEYITYKFSLPAAGGERLVAGAAVDVTELREAERALRESEQRFRCFMDNVPAVAWMKDEQGRYFYRNGRFQRDFGANEEAWLGKTDLDLWPEEIAESYRANDLRVLSDGTPSEFVEQSHHEGEPPRDWLVRKFPMVMDGSRTFVAGIGIDITERLRAESELRATAERYRRATENGRVVTWEADEGAAIRRIDPAFWEWVEAGPAEKPSDLHGWIAWHHPDDREQVARAIRAGLEERPGEILYDFRATLAGGGTGWFQCRGRVARGPDGQPLGAVGTIVDVTPQRLADERLRESRDRLRSVIDAAPDCIITIDDEGRVVEFNPAAVATFGYEREDVLGRPMTDLIPAGGEAEVELRGMDRYRSPGIATDVGNRVDLTARRRDGRAFPAELTLVESGYGSTVWLTGFLRDVSERRAAEQALQASERRMRTIFDYLTDPLLVTDVTGRVTEANPSACLSLGYSREQLLGMSVTEVDLTMNEDTVRALTQSILASPDGTVTFRGIQRRADGTTFPVEVRGRLIEWDGRPQFLSLSRDLTQRERAEEALRISEHRLRSIFEALADPLFLLDEFGRVLDINPSTCASLGRSREALLGLYVSDIDGQQGLEAIKEILRILRSHPGQPATFESLHRRADGSTYPVEVRALAVDWGGQERYLAMTRDLTERQRAEARLRESLSFQETLLEAIPTPVYYKDETGRYLGGNRAFYRFTGWCKDHVVGKSGDELPLNEWGAAGAAEDRHLLLNPGSHIYEGQARDAEGHPRDVVFHLATFTDADGRVRGIIGVILDVTERRRAEEAVRALNADLERRVAERAADVHKLAMIIDASTDFIGTASPEGQPLWQNAAFRRVAGISDEGGRHLAVITDIHTPQAARRTVEEGVPTALRIGNWIGESEIVAADGRVIPVSQLILAHRDPEGVVTFISTIMRDITERKRLEATLLERSEALSQANAELARASRLKDEFLASMSHELRTPLNAVLGFSEALTEQVYGTLTPEQATVIQDIERSGRHLLGLINDILDLSKIEAGQLGLDLAPTTLEAVCHASLRLVRQAALARRLKLTSTLDAGVGAIVADEMRLKQILVNLLSNAVKFTPEGGGVGLEVIGDRASQLLTFTVWDTGIGIREEDMGILFLPFRQIDSRLSRQYTGTGLGLALARRLAALHGGTISVESEPGKGSRFTVKIPWEPAPETLVPHALDSPRPDRAASGGAATGGSLAPLSAEIQEPPLLLLADDDELGGSMTADALTSAGYRVARARDGAEALRLTDELAPRLVLMDIQMPDMDGLEAIRRLRSEPRTRAIPVVALTAMAMHGDRERCLNAGAKAYLSKPVRLATLRRVIGELLVATTHGAEG